MEGHLLILGDAALTRDLPEVFLDFEVGIEETFDGALDALGRRTPDAVILDLGFDYGRPFRLVRHVREYEYFSPVPVVLVDAAGSDGKRDRDRDRTYRDLGADDFFDLHEAILQHGRDNALSQLRNRVLWCLAARGDVPRAKTGRGVFVDSTSSPSEPAYLGSALLRIGLGGLIARCRQCRSEHFALAEPGEPVTNLSVLICAICQAVTTQGELIVQIGNEALAAARRRLGSIGC